MLARLKKMMSSKYAHSVLWLWSFTESIIMPIPPDPFLMGIVSAKKTPHRSALWCLFGSLCGGVCGYAIGHYFHHEARDIITWMGSKKILNIVDSAQTYGKQWGFWFIILKGLTPIPYKIVTLASGFLHIPFGEFFWASLLSRGGRFFLVAHGVHYGTFFVQQYLKTFCHTYKRPFWILLTLLLVSGGIFLSHLLYTRVEYFSL